MVRPSLTSTLSMLSAVIFHTVQARSAGQYERIMETCVNSVIFNYRVSSKIQCGQLCDNNRPSCSGFCFSKADNSCKLHKVVDMGAGTQEFGFRTYKLFTNELNHHDSFYHCLAIGAHLALPKNLQQSDYLRQLSGGNAVHLATDDREHEGKWKTSGTTAEGGDQPLTYTDFQSGEPNNFEGKEHCGASRPDGWYDILCDMGTMRVCQAPKPEVCTTLPSTAYPDLRCYKRIK